MKLLLTVFILLFFTLNIKSQNKILFNNDSLQIDVDLKINNSMCFLKIFMMSEFNDYVSLYLNSVKIFSKKCETDTSTGQACNVDQILYLKHKKYYLQFKLKSINLQRNVKLEKGYEFLYIYKKERQIIFSYTNTKIYAE